MTATRHFVGVDSWLRPRRGSVVIEMTLGATSEQLREFLSRDRARVTESDREHWRTLLREGGPSAVFHLGDSMMHDRLLIDPQCMSAEARRADFEQHVLLKRRIDAAAAFIACPRTR